MYWRQAAVGATAGLAGGFAIYTRGSALGTALASGVALYIGIRWVMATVGRTRYWRHRNGPRRTCGTCGKSIRRQPGDWIRTCYRCGSQAGWPGLRWLTHSVPSAQLRRTVLGPQLLVLTLVGVLVVSGAAAGFTVADLPGPQRNVGGSGGVGPKTDDRPGTRASQSEITTTVTSDGAAPTTVDAVPVGDRDGDRLGNREEGEPPFSNSSTGHKDIYLRVVIGGGVEHLPYEWLQTVQRIFEEMPIGNPDGTNGITIHILEVVRMDSPLAVSDGRSSIGKAMDQIPAYTGPIQCGNYHTLILTSWSGNEVSGRGSAPGVVSVVDTTYPEFSNKRAVLTGTIVHELLHNIVGQRLDPSEPRVMTEAHTSDGWLAGGSSLVGTNRFLSDPVQRVLSEDGFASLDNILLRCS